MSRFISYAQNFEDILLRRVFGFDRDGFYVDVGAADPTVNSVTRTFYDAGWSGINIEPRDEYFTRLENERQRDHNICAAAAQYDGVSTFFQFPAFPELGTLREAAASAIEGAGAEMLTEQVRTVALTSVLSKLNWPTVDFLKIDVEGAEIDVLRGLDLVKCRPLVIVVETVSGNLGRTSECADYLAGADYQHAYFDGVNDWFVPYEHSELRSHFETPVNVSDQFELASSDAERVTLRAIANRIGAHDFSDDREILERVDALIADRIRYENLLNDQINSSHLELQNRGLKLELDELWRKVWLVHRQVAVLAAENHNLQAIVREVHELRAELEVERARSSEARTTIQLMRSSISWKLTLPIRALRRPRHYIRRLRLR